MGETILPGPPRLHAAAVPPASDVPSRSRTCRLDGHEPDEPVVSELGNAAQVRAVVHCRRCGSYISSFEGPLRPVQRAAAALGMHGLRWVPV